MSVLDYQKTIDDFRKRTTASPWVHLPRAAVADRLRELIECPDLVQQGPIGLCGPAAFLRVWLERAPQAVAEHAIRLYETGRSTIGPLSVVPCAALLAADYPTIGAKYGSNFPGAAEWMVMGALRDSENFWMRFEGAPAHSWPEEVRWLEQAIREGSMQDEVASWLRAAGIYSSVADATSKVAVDLDLGGALDIGTLDVGHALAHPPTASHDVIWLINAKLIAPDAPSTSAIADHFVVPLRPVRRLSGDRVGITLFSWGRAYYLERSRAEFEHAYYGAIDGITALPRVVLPIAPKTPFGAWVEEVPGPALRLAWQSSSPNDVTYDVERQREADPTFSLAGDARAFDPPTVGTHFDDAGSAAYHGSLRYRVSATSPYGTTPFSDEAWFDAVLRFRLAAWFTAESVALARLGGYAASVRNQVDAGPHLAWALTQTSAAMLADLREKFQLQFSHQLDHGTSAACDLYADTVMRYLRAGITFDESTSDEGATNSTSRADHWGYAHSMLTPLSAGRLDRLRAELDRRVRDAADHARAGRRQLLAALYTAEQVRLAPLSRLSGPDDGDARPATHRAWADAHWPEALRDRLVTRYLAELDSLHALTNGTAYVADFYAQAAVAWNAFGVDLGSQTASSVDPAIHSAWAASAPYPEVRDALAMRVRCVSERLAEPEPFARLLALHARQPDGTWQALAKPYRLVLGSVAPGQEVTGRLRFSNPGGGTYFVALSGLTGGFSTADTTVDVPYAPVDARRTVEVTVTFRAGQPGVVSGTLTLSTSAPGAQTVVVALEATVRGAKLSAVPAALDLGAVKPGERTSGRFVVRNEGTATAQIVDAQLQPWPGPFDTANAFPWLPAGLAPGESYVVAVELAPTAAGPVSGQQTIRYRHLITEPLTELVVPLSGRGAAPRIELPSTLEWPTLAPGATGAMGLTIANRGDAELVLSRLSLDDVAREAGFRLLDGGVERTEIPEPYYGPPESAPPAPCLVVPAQGTLVFTLVASARPGGGTSGGALTVASDDRDRPSAVVTLRATTAGPARIVVHPERIDFGKVAPRERPSRLVSIRNSGFEALEVSRIWIEGDSRGRRDTSFQVDPDGPLQVPAGGVATVRVRFVGQHADDHHATLWVESNDPRRPRVSAQIVAVRAAQRLLPGPL